ncbi:hypothetical protein BDZ90DRAFT_274701 [Jaminaea rosea]|uniref:4Fe-4S ferredoxin-type domain-containing protein n=1 Tax=Jaminaea rosea TaxID=1569628 RepID=A0A316UQP4_9BASI|nr:hypothetical protein BDZ90DRAFT_274701 [Jaminaea rosea]PWN27294.1 hypothetical protein BDZ90DRAFT_274701 [Jaminaea rosea]
MMQLIRFSLASSALVALASLSTIKIVEALPTNVRLTRSFARDVQLTTDALILGKNTELGGRMRAADDKLEQLMIRASRTIEGGQGGQVDKRQPVTDSSFSDIVLRDIAASKTVSVNSRLLGPCSNCACGINCPSTCCGLKEVRTEPVGHLATFREQSDMPSAKREIDGSQGSQLIERQVTTDTMSKGLVILRDINPCHSCDCQTGCPAGCCGLDKVGMQTGRQWSNRKVGTGEGGRTIERKLEIDAPAEGIEIRAEGGDDH